MNTSTRHSQLPIPDHFNPDAVGQVWRVPYEERARQARRWAGLHAIRPAAEDEFKIAFLGVDLQNTFCIPEYELYVGGRSGTGAVDDNRRLVTFLYQNLGQITHIALTLDTHQAIQIFHAIFLIDAQGNHPPANTLVSVEDVVQGRWKFNPAVAPSLGITPEYGQELLESYTRQLKEQGKYDLTIWPYHAMLGSTGHALVSAVEEAVFFHTIARASQPDMIIKGNQPLTESYSVIGPEVQEGPDGRVLGRKSSRIFEKLQQYDALVIAGQAKSHCVAWTVEDLLADVRQQDESLVRKIYLLEDCCSPVVVPGIVDYTDQADAAFEKFRQAGINLMRSDQPLSTWPGIAGHISSA